jgi:hypothetical protein
MAWLSRKRLAELEELEKARNAAPMGGKDASQLVNLMVRASGRDVDLDFNGSPLLRPEEWLDAFGPGHPLGIEPLDRPRPDSGLPDPRQYQYPVSNNLRYFSDRLVGWDTLRSTSETPLFRACIEVKKQELSTLDWVIRVSPEAAEQQAREAGTSKEDIEARLRVQYKDEIKRCTDFWENPDRRNGRDFQEWISIALEEQLVFDAIAIYPRRTYGGELLDLMLIDGSTIKPILDEQGSRPEPPSVAYQQILYGFPRGEFQADYLTDPKTGQQTVPGGLQSTQLVYRRRVPRLHNPYGFGPTEQALLDGLLYNKRFEWMLSEYTQGTAARGWVKVPENSPFSARQILEMERQYNDRYGGQTAERYRQQFMPPGFELQENHAIEERYKADYDLHLIKLVAMHFGLTVTELGFTEQGGLGSSGYHEGQQDIQFRKGLLPDTRWFSKFLTMISRTQLQMSPDLEFAFLGMDDEDEASADSVDENRVKSGRMTINEARVRAGMPPVGVPEADMLHEQTARGVVFLDGASKLAPAGVMIEPASEQVNTDPEGQPVSPTQRRPVKSTSPKAGAAAKDIADEIRAYRKWDKRNPGAARPFRFEMVTADLAKDLAPDLIGQGNVEFAKGDADPKAPWSPYSSLG